MKTRKLNSKEIFEIMESEFFNLSSDHSIQEAIRRVKTKVRYIETIPAKGKMKSFLDKSQASLWFFILITSFAFAAKIVIENYFYKY